MKTIRIKRLSTRNQEYQLEYIKMNPMSWEADYRVRHGNSGSWISWRKTKHLEKTLKRLGFIGSVDLSSDMEFERMFNRGFIILSKSIIRRFINDGRLGSVLYSYAKRSDDKWVLPSRAFQPELNYKYLKKVLKT